MNAVKKQYGLETGDFTAETDFDELERQYGALKALFKEEWKKTKKKIRREVLKPQTALRFSISAFAAISERASSSRLRLSCSSKSIYSSASLPVSSIRIFRVRGANTVSECAARGRRG